MSYTKQSLVTFKDTTSSLGLDKIANGNYVISWSITDSALIKILFIRNNYGI
jgi:hypothetical protein